jgi:hypothetical protein
MVVKRELSNLLIELGIFFSHILSLFLCRILAILYCSGTSLLIIFIDQRNALLYRSLVIISATMFASINRILRAAG